MDSGTATVIAEQFALGEVLQCASLNGTRNQNYVLDTTSGRWFVRERYAGYSAREWVAFDSEAMAFLSERGVPVSVPRAARDGRRWWVNVECGACFAIRGLWAWLQDRSKLRSPHEDRSKLRTPNGVWQVYPFIAGHAIEEGNVEEVRAVGRAVGHFHRAGQVFTERYDKLGPRGETSPAELGRIAETLESEGPECAEPLRRYREWIPQAAAALPDDRYNALPHTLVHGDIQPANVVIAEDGVPWLVDLDWCAWQPRVYDLGFALLFCCAERDAAIDGSDIWSLTQPCRLRKDLMDTFLDAYANACAALSPEETAMLRPQMVLSWCSSRLAGALKVPVVDRAAFLARPPTTRSELGLDD